MQIAPQVLELEGADVGRVQLSFEQVELLDADFIGILTQGADPSVLPGWDSLRAVRNGTVHEFEYTDVVGINTPSALSLPYVMDVVRPTLRDRGRRLTGPTTDGHPSGDPPGSCRRRLATAARVA